MEELEAREAAARVRVEELEAEIAELTARLVVERRAVAKSRTDGVVAGQGVWPSTVAQLV
ncbi:hypothetical protein [Streptomyces sp. NPDC048419]|uniref:hypothetical protein n=1 Tax=Streptomyces sp. NPDC048419 TaxID=3365547 RepID=UPI003713441B